MMRGKKHIDRLYQEKFKNFEVTPDGAAWENIQSRLDKRRRVVPIWWRYAGVAALLLLLFTVGNLFFEKNEAIPKSQVVDTNENSNLLDNNEAGLNEIENKDSRLNDESKERNRNSLPLETPSENIVTTKPPVEKATGKVTDSSNKNPSFIVDDLQKIVDSSKNNPEEESKSVVTGTEDKNNSRLKTASIEPDDFISDPNKKTALENKENSIPALVNNDLGKEESNDDPSNESELLSIEEEIEKNKDLIEKEKSKNRWSVSPNIAPVYYNSLGKGSHIDDQFVNNSKSGELNTSYGVIVAYAMNDKISIRSGIHSVNLSYDTDNVIIFQSLSSPVLNNLPRTNQLKNITLSSKAQNISAISGENLFVQESIGLFPNENAAISQRISYYEIPIELQYDLIRKNKSFGLNIIGGFSTFFLNSNEVYSEFQDRKNYIGKANNINDLSFSANFGVGINYSFSEKFNFNLEPTFKYQINAYDNTSGDFRPYIIGVYTGFSFKF